ncbi:Si-specific NAD(P)(+) transhydrogenase [Marinibactrum halimedae]|uniref:Soluble pyridine nucleotide transhydrogenase n=1 Tax=Marinibactrum halimedae TaxID=1444977 RepID=A0AA37WQJ1_9GAMM|nr:Si-specific NAD(P)(+) transhydrogenase [Marinibactrum halimedae]MCD9459477.1 Si-specific NAD(P)(+) transhydrogenase [Marinibactrum halimedae]GLS28131.1 soluble pyridine nucleotide transhydrogenase [Marinibactrum halimedae]
MGELFKYDVLVIGSGPAGESAAISAAKNGKQVGIVESRAMVGGNCAHKGTIPSKALRHAVKQIIRFNNNSLFRQLGEVRKLSFPQVLASASEVIPKQVEMHTNHYSRNRIHVHIGLARFEDEHTVKVANQDGGTETITAEKFIITTGSRPYRPADVDFNHPRVYDSDTILEMSHTPNTLVIYGAGVIGCEYASIFAGLGVKVDLINSRDRLLSFLDDEISDALSYHLRDTGVMVRHNEEYSEVKADASGVTLHLKSGKRLRADALLWCNGRSGNTESLNLEAVGLGANHRGQIEVNEHYQTANENIFAAGDVIGWPSLASASFDQGRAAAKAVLGMPERYEADAPTGIYTLPEISSIGQTERELTAAKIPYEVGRAFFKHTARGQISGEDVGMLKLLFHVDTNEILGIHCFGAEASEIVHIGQAILKQTGEANDIHYFATTTFNYPTMAEAYRQAALNGLNRVKRMYR